MTGPHVLPRGRVLSAKLPRISPRDSGGCDPSSMDVHGLTELLTELPTELLTELPDQVFFSSSLSIYRCARQNSEVVKDPSTSDRSTSFVRSFVMSFVRTADPGRAGDAGTPGGKQTNARRPNHRGRPHGTHPRAPRTTLRRNGLRRHPVATSHGNGHTRPLVWTKGQSRHASLSETVAAQGRRSDFSEHRHVTEAPHPRADGQASNRSSRDGRPRTRGLEPTRDPKHALTSGSLTRGCFRRRSLRVCYSPRAQTPIARTGCVTDVSVQAPPMSHTQCQWEARHEG